MYADHSGLNKYTGSDDPNYISASGVILRMMERVPPQEIAPSGTSRQEELPTHRYSTPLQSIVRQMTDQSRNQGGCGLRRCLSVVLRPRRHLEPSL